MTDKAPSTDTLGGREATHLLRTFLRLRTLSEARRFIRDLMTEEEIRMIVERWRVARLLDQGVSYREIERQTGASSRTIARISRWLREGEGGYRRMLAHAHTGGRQR